MGQGARRPGARGGCADELARAGIVDPDFRTRRSLRVHRRRVEQGGGDQALPVWEGRGAVLPTGEKEGRVKGWNPWDPGNPSHRDITLQGACGSWSGLGLCRSLGHRPALSALLSLRLFAALPVNPAPALMERGAREPSPPTPRPTHLRTALPQPPPPSMLDSADTPGLDRAFPASKHL